jgi:hypothetical protein
MQKVQELTAISRLISHAESHLNDLGIDDPKFKELCEELQTRLMLHLIDGNSEMDLAS